MFWEEELRAAIIDGKGSNFEARIKCLAWAATVYFIKQERNARTFKDERHTQEYVVERFGKI